MIHKFRTWQRLPVLAQLEIPAYDGSAARRLDPDRAQQQVDGVQAERADQQHPGHGVCERWTVVAGVRLRLGEPLRDQQEFRADRRHKEK
jgi:hypothetical protein